MKSCAQKKPFETTQRRKRKSTDRVFGREKERFRLAKFSEIPEKYTQMASSGKIYLFLMSVCRYAVNQPESTQHSLVGSLGIHAEVEKERRERRESGTFLTSARFFAKWSILCAHILHSGSALTMPFLLREKKAETYGNLKLSSFRTPNNTHRFFPFVLHVLNGTLSPSSLYVHAAAAAVRVLVRVCLTHSHRGNQQEKDAEMLELTSKGNKALEMVINHFCCTHFATLHKTPFFPQIANIHSLPLWPLAVG